MRKTLPALDAEIALLERQQKKLEMEIGTLRILRSSILLGDGPPYTKREAMRIERFGLAVSRECDAQEAIEDAAS